MMYQSCFNFSAVDKASDNKVLKSNKYYGRSHCVPDRLNHISSLGLSVGECLWVSKCEVCSSEDVCARSIFLV